MFDKITQNLKCIQIDNKLDNTNALSSIKASSETNIYKEKSTSSYTCLEEQYDNENFNGDTKSIFQMIRNKFQDKPNKDCKSFAMFNKVLMNTSKNKSPQNPICELKRDNMSAIFKKKNVDLKNEGFPRFNHVKTMVSKIENGWKNDLYEKKNNKFKALNFSFRRKLVKSHSVHTSFDRGLKKKMNIQDNFIFKQLFRLFNPQKIKKREIPICNEKIHSVFREICNESNQMSSSRDSIEDLYSNLIDMLERKKSNGIKNFMSSSTLSSKCEISPSDQTFYSKCMTLDKKMENQKVDEKNQHILPQPVLVYDSNNSKPTFLDSDSAFSTRDTSHSSEQSHSPTYSIFQVSRSKTMDGLYKKNSDIYASVKKKPQLKSLINQTLQRSASTRPQKKINENEIYDTIDDVYVYNSIFDEKRIYDQINPQPIYGEVVNVKKSELIYNLPSKPIYESWQDLRKIIKKPPKIYSKLKHNERNKNPSPSPRII